MKKIVVVHPEKQHSQYLAEALKLNHNLYKYVTTVYNKKGSVSNLIQGLLKGDARKRAKTRVSAILEEHDVVLFCQLSALFCLFLQRMPVFKSFFQKLNKRITSSMYNRVYTKTIKRFANSADAIIFFGGLRKQNVDLLKKLNPKIKCILDIPVLNGKFVDVILKRDAEISGEQPTINEISRKKQLEKQEELDYVYSKSDGFICGSSVSADSMLYSGIDKRLVKVVNYGTSLSVFKQKDYSSKETTTFIFVGRVERKKGVHYLLDAFSRLDKNKAGLLICGAYDKEDVFFKEYGQKENIEFLGLLTRDKLVEKYKESDVLVLPSLCDGFGLVVSEAFATGIPAIVSEYTGAKDLIEDGENGFIFSLFDEDSLYNKMKYFVDNPDEAIEMGKNGRATVLNYTWDNYYCEVNKAVCSLIENR